jgi:urease accessory protein UreE
VSRRFVLGIAIAAALAVPAYARAHEGHVHKVMGTVMTRDQNRLEVKTTAGKTVTITLTDKTSILRGKNKLSAADLQPGERVVVNVGAGKEPFTAREVKLGVAKATARK